MKNNRKTIIMAALSLLTGLVIGWLLFDGSAQKPVDERPHVVEKTGKTIWTCSMHPQIRQNEPGDCPICGMDLIPLESRDDDRSDPMAISMSPAAMQLAGVGTARVTAVDPVKTVRLNGKVQADQRLVFSQSSHIPGRIETLVVNFTGEFVNKGQTIAHIYSPELVTAQEELFEARKIKETQPLLFKAAKAKLKNWKLSDQQVEEILKSEKIQTRFPVQADATGYVTQKMVNPGDYIERGKAIFEITDLSKVWVLFDVYESDMSWIQKGDTVEFIVASLPGETFQGKIAYLDPVIDPKTRVSKARVEIQNSEAKLKPEMFVTGTVQVRLPAKTKVMAVPKTAVMWTGKRSVVYVKNKSDKGVNFSMREVTLGPSLGESYVVEDGLQIGEEIALSGTFSIDAAAQLAGKPSMMSPEGGPAMTGHNHGDVKIPAVPEKPAKTAAAGPLSIGQEARDELWPLYAAYLAFKDALVSGNFAEAQKAAVRMQAGLDKVDMAVFLGPSHDAWMTFSRDLVKALEHVPHYQGLEELRKAFQHVSATMIAMTRSFRPMDKTIHIQHCPMADDNKGADWLSLDRDVKNPYYGQSMLTCGEVTETIQ
ncbi:MAG: efflux RND transporter periplasmic adaptor subunit [Desulfobacteraceae bacterium]|nr:MAG: efflux RND transporter periplasmic adaptor subunit [Desulfobacteraceae bacterium]